MTWPWNRGVREAEEQLEKAREDLDATRRRWPEVRASAKKLDRHLAENGFGLAIQIAMGAKKS